MTCAASPTLTPSATGSTLGPVAGPWYNRPCGGPPPQPLRPPGVAVARRGGGGAGWRAAGGGVRGRPRGQSRVGSRVAMQHRGLAHPVPSGPMEGHDVPPGGISGVGLHVGHPPSRHGPTSMASSGRGHLLVLGAAHGECYLDTLVGHGARCWLRGGLFGAAPRVCNIPAVDYVPASPHCRGPDGGGGPGGPSAGG